MNETWWVAKEQLVPEQLSVIELPLLGSYLVLGPPGSGKTNLLLLRANYLHLAGHPEISVIVFTRTLQEFLTSGAVQYDFPPKKIVTSMKWMGALLKSYGRTPPKGRNFPETRKLTVEATQSLVDEKNLSELHEVILLDEAQDYSPAEIEIFSKLASHIFVVADSRQKIYKGSDPIKLITKCVDETKKLKHHFRNGTKICRLADAIAKDSKDYESMEPTSNYKESVRPSSVEHHRCVNFAEQSARILAKLDLQRKAYPDELLGICCPRMDEVEAVGAALSGTPFADVATIQKRNGHCEFTPETRICVSTIHGAKGLEFRALHLAGLQFLDSFDFNRNLALTGVTRAKTSLSLYYSSTIPAFLEKAIQGLQPPPELPEISSLFGKGK